MDALNLSNSGTFGMLKRRATTSFIATLILFGLVHDLAAQERPANFGQRWVRTHPLTLMGLQQWPSTFNAQQHRNANMSSVLAWWADGNGKQIAASASANGLPWHALIVDGEGDERDRINDYASVGNAAGWMIGDELNRQQMPWFGDIVAWTKRNRPQDLAYTNAYPTYAGDAGLFGGAPPPGGYGYLQYLQDMVQIVKPDVLMYDHYPFFNDGTTRGDYFSNMMQVRQKALEHNLPYWMFAQASQHFAYRLPSASDVRMQVFSHLAAGFTGVSYFTFDNFGSASILLPSGAPSALYPRVAALNREAANLGQALRFMTSNDVKYVSGSHVSSGLVVKNPVPTGLQEWTPAGDADDHILSITIPSVGPKLDGLIGFFTDDRGDDAFMLVNAFQSPNSQEQAGMTFTIQFDNSIDELLRLDRVTGEQILVPLMGHQLSIRIQAGTGELFKYNEGDFLLAVPEPASARFFVAGMLVLSSIKRTAPATEPGCNARS
jgi:hypothetical protein